MGRRGLKGNIYSLNSYGKKKANTQQWPEKKDDAKQKESQRSPNSILDQKDRRKGGMAKNALWGGPKKIKVLMASPKGKKKSRVKRKSRHTGVRERKQPIGR